MFQTYFDVEVEDLSSIKIMLEFVKTSTSIGCEGGRWSWVETDLARCLQSASSLLLPLPLRLGLDETKYPKYMWDALHKQSGAPEFVAFADIATEFVRPTSMEVLAVKLFFYYFNFLSENIH